MKIILSFAFLFIMVHAANAQKRKRQKKAIVPIENVAENVLAHIRVLASDSLQGRRTGTIGEQLAANYIISQMQAIGIAAQGSNNTYLQPFVIQEGRTYASSSLFKIGDTVLVANQDYFPLNFSGNGTVTEVASVLMKEANTTWFLDLKEELTKNEKNPHYDITPYILAKCKEYIGKGASGVILYNTHNKLSDNLAFDTKAKDTTLTKPIVYLTKPVYQKYITTKDAAIDIKYNITITQVQRTGHNVVGYINNNAPTTIVIGAHYDHLGYGEDKNSLYTGQAAIHNGADDNASGVAALIELARYYKKTETTKAYNYLFIAFSGEELGLYGSKYFVEHPTIPLSTVNYMINMDMIGRLPDSSKAFTIGGFGTSPTWAHVIKPTDKWNALNIKLDTSGTGPSDHSTFYRKDIPVLFFFTGTHTDYHKPSDDIEKINIAGEVSIINYIQNVISHTSTLPKLAFTKTKENNSGGSNTRFTVSLGVMPDYTYGGTGVMVDGVSEGKLAQRTGLAAGDVLVKLGDYTITNVENYMQVLSKFKKGDTTILVTNRNGKQLSYNITF